VTEPSTGLGFDEVSGLLPQKFPFLMLDRVLSIEKGKSLIALKNVTGNEIFFLGHFPGMAVMPGALIIESMAQAAIVLFRSSFDAGDAAAGENQGRIFFFGAARARFLHPVVPGDQLRLEVTITKAISTGGIVDAVASVDGRVVSKASLTFGVKKREDFHG
jgi:3-hydroxyacyl-[acyl-carrier-protein] dehydratase